MRRIIALILTLLLGFSLAACGGSNSADTESGEGNAVSATDSDLAKVEEAGQIVVGMECAYAPYNWSQTEENEYTVEISDGLYADGYDIQIAKRIAEDLGAELVIKPTEWSGLISALESGQIDLIIAGMSPTEERKLSIDFTDTYYDSNLVVVVKKDSPYAAAESIADFSGAKLTAQLNTFHYTVLDQIEGLDKQTALEDFASLIQSLESDTIDGYVCEKPGAISAVSSHPDFTFVEFEDGNGFECDPAESSISVGVRKGSDLTDSINETLSGISKEEREQLMDEAVSRQPSAE